MKKYLLVFSVFLAIASQSYADTHMRLKEVGSDSKLIQVLDLDEDEASYLQLEYGAKLTVIENQGEVLAWFNNDRTSEGVLKVYIEGKQVVEDMIKAGDTKSFKHIKIWNGKTIKMGNSVQVRFTSESILSLSMLASSYTTLYMRRVGKYEGQTIYLTVW